MRPAIFAVGIEVETPGGRHDFERFTDLQLIRCKLRKLPTRLNAYSDLQRPATTRRTNTVGAPQVFTVALYLDRQVLARQKRELCTQFFRHIEGDPH